MQKILKQSILIPSSIQVELENSQLIFHGPLGQISLDLHQHDKVGECFFFLESLETGQRVLSFTSTKKKKKIFLNSFKSLLSQYFTGLTQGFLVILECVGIGYKVQLQKNALELKVGFSHSIEYVLPKDVQVFLPKSNVICFFGIDKKRLYQVASQVQSIKSPDVYKGKGLRFKNVKYFLKEGKKK